MVVVIVSSVSMGMDAEDGYESGRVGFYSDPLAYPQFLEIYSRVNYSQNLCSIRVCYLTP